MPNEQLPQRPAVTSRRQLAETFQTNLQTVDGWKRDWKQISDCPCGTRYYDLLWVSEWLLTRRKTPPKFRKIACGILGIEHTNYGEPTTTDGEPTVDLKRKLLAAQVRSEEAKALGSEIKNRTAEADLVERHFVRQFVSQFLTQTRTVFSRIPADMQAGLPAKNRKAIRKELETRIELALRSLHGFISEVDRLK